MKHAREFLALATAKWPPYERCSHSLFVHPVSGLLGLQLVRGGEGVPENRRMMVFTVEDSDLARPAADLIAEVDALLTELDRAASENVVSLPAPSPSAPDGPEAA